MVDLFISSYYNLTIGANDRRNFSDFATVVIYVMRRSFLFHLFIDNPPEVVKDQQEELKILLGKSCSFLPLSESLQRIQLEKRNFTNAFFKLWHNFDVFDRVGLNP